MQQFQGSGCNWSRRSQSRLGAGRGQQRAGRQLRGRRARLGRAGQDPRLPRPARLRRGSCDFLPDRAPLPEHKAFFLLVHLVRLYVGAELDFDVQLVLKADAVPECQLTEEAAGARLGWNTWLTSQQPARPAGDAVFAAEEVVRVDETMPIRL